MRWSAFFVLFALGSLLRPAIAADFEDPPSELAAVLVRKAKSAEKSGDLAQAYVYYSQASALQPKNRGYRAAAAALQTRGAAQIKSASAPPPDIAGMGTDPEDRHAALPGNSLDSLTARELALGPELSSPPKLNAARGRYDFDLNAPPRTLFDKIATGFGLQIVFDSDYPPGGDPLHFRITQVDYREALDALQAATGSFVVPVSSKVIMVAKDTAAKRNDLEQYVTLTVPVPQVLTTQELTEIVQLVRQVSSVEKIGWDTNDDEIVMRDRISRVALAKDLLDELFAYHPEVMIDLELLLMVSSTKSMHGHALGAAGALEAAATLFALQRGIIPPTANFTERDPACDLDVVPNAARPAQVEYALSNSFAFGGLNAVLVLRAA